MSVSDSWSNHQEIEFRWVTSCPTNLLKHLQIDAKRHALDGRLDEITNMIGSYLWMIEDQFKVAIQARTTEHDWKPNLSAFTQMVWTMFYTAARFCSTLQRDRLVVELMLLHGAGDMTWFGDDNQKNVASIGKHVLWTDMPFFAEDMIYFWNLEFATMSRSQRRNVHYFLATAAGGNIISAKLCAVGILVLREAFETTRDMGDDNAEDVEDSNRKIQDLTVLDLLGCAELWMLKAWDPIRRLSSIGFCDYPQEVGRLGPLAREAGVPDNGGFTKERLDFWSARFHGIIKLRHPERKIRTSTERWPDSFDSFV
ncbi:hypothetical protein PFICI_01608 [Pestalotiopsis fici W106-1]|uniref:Uncharacterized protein n=1 Tax=Pestalotiopsis fici (strain W106-1 / CGMCC3.15140) TaxID=1229662 RepID=W3XP99_PESFW|nr:uncharacterized protein PFICI_01608 [Pestalotiopsis fici W106-1]ETS87780.1 hypothetical protein PFICI_01608 [Pestalotiopsis fici W106-1]